ncbi:MAG: nucleotidyltransferase family protein [Nanoarchaeota archaeon]|nr:nucleotidyltransferase family protein [Nanoarchaeota archaeon]
MEKKLEIEEIKKIISPLLKNNGVKKAGIFGSYARGEQRENSDIDVLVKINDEFGLIETIRLKKILQDAINKKVDLVEYETIRPELKEIILGDEISIL